MHKTGSALPLRQYHSGVVSPTSGKPRGLSLHDLPSETLAHCASFLGSCHFQKHPEHLTLSKQWYPIALREFHRDIHITASQVPSLYRRVIKSTSADGPLSWAQSETKPLNIELDASGFGVQGYNRLDGCLYSVINDISERKDVAESVATAFTRMQSLRTLRLNIHTDNNVHPWGEIFQ